MPLLIGSRALRQPGGHPAWRLPFGLLSALWASAALGAAPASAASPPFVDLVDHPRPEANWDRFFALEDRLSGAFGADCASGACSTRPWFLLPMQLRCTVRVADATVAACVWVIAGSDLRVRAAGSIEPDVVVWRCTMPLPVPGGIAVEAFHALLDVENPLSVRLPGAQRTVRQGLRDCLEQPGARS